MNLVENENENSAAILVIQILGKSRYPSAIHLFNNPFLEPTYLHGIEFLGIQKKKKMYS